MFLRQTCIILRLMLGIKKKKSSAPMARMQNGTSPGKHGLVVPHGVKCRSSLRSGGRAHVPSSREPTQSLTSSHPSASTAAPRAQAPRDQRPTCPSASERIIKTDHTGVEQHETQVKFQSMPQDESPLKTPCYVKAQTLQILPQKERYYTIPSMRGM